jgi:hypothetical protein
MLDRVMPWLIVTAIIGVPSLLLAVPAAVRTRSWSLSGLAFVQSAGGIVVPLLAFVASAFLVPEWKGGCRLGAVDCFHAGKLALLPLVLWSMAAFYRATVRQPRPPHRRWVRLGLVHGAAISGVCVVHGLLTLRAEPPLIAGMLIPLYTAAWYALTAYRVAYRDEPTITPAEERTVAFSGVPLWLLAAALSALQYRGLPTSPPSCFVVTAASRGHRRLVGPLLPVPRAGRLRRASAQLLTFWSLEAAWSRRSPATHRAFRQFYNRVGPHVARHIRGPWTADAVYLCLKPLEWAAQHAVRPRR